MRTYKLKSFASKGYQNEAVFLLLFVFALLLDVSMKFDTATVFYRYFTKFFGTVLLLAYVYVNSNNIKRQRVKLIVAALVLFLLSDIFFIKRNVFWSFNVAVGILVLAKLCFIQCFFNYNDFKVSKLIPFLIFSFTYLTSILYLIFENLTQNYLIQVLIYFFVVLLFALFAFLREGAVNKLSYRFVFLGVLISFVSDGITTLNLFSNSFTYNTLTSVIITLAYGISQYLIVIGLLHEKIKPELNRNKL